jgi:diguanylate cyclase (GGDEF)-like protein
MASTQRRTDPHSGLSPVSPAIDLDALPDAAFIVQRGRLIAANRRAQSLLGAQHVSELTERGAIDFVHPSSRASAALRLSRVIDSGDDPAADPGVGTMDETMQPLSGEPIHVESSVSRIVVEGHPAALYLVRPLRQSLEDPLTGLPNRALLMDRLGHALSQASRRDGHVAVLFLDLDNFKVVNDSLGHSVGDRLLKQVADRLDETIRVGDTLARFGGDEFVVICDCVGSLSDAEVLATRLADALQRPFALDDGDFHLSVSIGIALGGPSDTPETVLRDSDAAMHQAKASGRNRTGVFTAALRARTVARLDTDGALRRAIDRQELTLHYQPVVDLLTGRVTGVEALVRWDRPEVGFVPPADFIPLAEENGLIMQIGQMVLDEACQQAAAWAKDGHDLLMGVNLSTSQLADPGLAAFVAETLARHGVAPGRLCLEVTESRLMQNLEQARVTLAVLRELGILLAIDDFGTGYSSLAQLCSLPFSWLKIDRCFVSDLTRDRAGEKVLGSVLHLAGSLEMSAVAEGVETAEQLETLRRLGCDTAQGFHIARPMPAADITVLMKPRAPLESCRPAPKS